MIQQTSLFSYVSIKPGLGERQRQVLEALKVLGEANNLMIAKKLGLPINMVTPRVFELRKMGAIVESYRDFCPYTKHMTIFWRII